MLARMIVLPMWQRYNPHYMILVEFRRFRHIICRRFRPVLRAGSPRATFKVVCFIYRLRGFM